MSLYQKRVICIHSLDNKTLTSECFIQYVNFVKSIGYKFVNIDEILSNKCKRKSLSLTIDDGYKNNITNLLPLLKKLKIPALLFVPTGLLGLKANDELLIKQDCYLDQDMMNVEDVKKWINEGFEVGFHTHNHIDLSKASIEEMIEDFQLGMNFFKGIKYKPKYFAYPKGFLPNNKELFEALLRKNNFENAFTFTWGNIKNGTQYYMPRFSLGNNQAIWWSALKTLGLLDWRNKIKRKKYEK